MYKFVLQGVCTEAGMYALRERRVHVTQEDFEMAVAKVLLVIDIRDKGNTQIYTAAFPNEFFLYIEL